VVALSGGKRELARRFVVTAVDGNRVTLDCDAGAARTAGYRVLRPRYEQDDRFLHFHNMSLYRAWPEAAETVFFPWYHFNGGLEASCGVHLETSGKAGEFVTVIVPRKPGAAAGDDPRAAPVYEQRKLPELAAIPNGVRVGDTEVVFGGGIDDEDAVTYVSVKAAKPVLELTGRDIDMDRSQGEVGLFVPDAGYPFGEIPDWLIRQRAGIKP
jgi:hypothetical protein